MKKSIVAIAAGLMVSFGAHSANMWKTVYNQMDLGGSSTPNEKVHIECHMDLIGVNLTHREDVITQKMNKAPNRKRCEFAVQGVLKRDTPFSLSFDFKVNSNFAHYKQWQSYFQIHNRPDKGERWRCPILALESVNGALRMFNRWDPNSMSVTKNHTCANKGNSIQSRTLFRNVPYESNTWHRVELSGELSHSKDACLTVKIDGNVVSDVCGPNTFNDEKEPYFKLGIYKPTSWETSDEEIVIQYKNIRYRKLVTH
ncbi:exported hypothetical protein [Vibrio nigripulchritudo SOn1]|uniref:Alginate lyase n=1 Tax=Vibrio nigripulchritudo SOn1 TaxID=1238450 RepID=A0AAV2VQK9_9VIBR|nr:heparin lyase I family protein [Vibrio nigripulchritudo]CCO46718.1 exported hypothetical protein [Vibrio nigripulchritudo SOn1]